MADNLKGQYVPAQHIEALRYRVEALAAMIHEIGQELESFDLINISFHKGSGNAGSAAKPAASEKAAEAKRTPEPEPELKSEDDYKPEAEAPPKVSRRKQESDARAALRSDDRVAEARAKLTAARREVPKPKVVEPKQAGQGKRPFANRERVGKLKQSLEIEHGREVAGHMVAMCERGGQKCVTLNLRKIRELFIGTFRDAAEGAKAYDKMIGRPWDAAQVESLPLTAGGVAVWVAEQDRDALKKYREKERQGDQATAGHDEAASA